MERSRLMKHLKRHYWFLRLYGCLSLLQKQLRCAETQQDDMRLTVTQTFVQTATPERLGQPAYPLLTYPCFTVCSSISHSPLRLSKVRPPTLASRA